MEDSHSDFSEAQDHDMQNYSSCLAISIALGVLSAAAHAQTSKLMIIGAGISGLSTALEAAHKGADVVVLDSSTVGGGHAIVSNAAICLVDTPLQKRKGIKDSAALAEQDFIARGEDADRKWVSLYVRESKPQIYDWLISLGVQFYGCAQTPGNSVPRLHFVKGKGWALVKPLLRACFREPKIQFVWGTKAEQLLVENGRVVGVEGRELRTGKKVSLRGSNVVVATGGFGSNLKLIRDNWPPSLARPERLLAGSSHAALGSGFDLVRAVGGGVSRLDHQWNYVLGLPDPENKLRNQGGLTAFDFHSVWVNDRGNRFTPEFGDEKVNLKALLQQPEGNYWSIFDADGRSSFSITLAGWGSAKEIDRTIFQTPGVAISADTLDKLGGKIGIDPSSLLKTVRRFNNFVDGGLDKDFNAFDKETKPRPHKIEKPSFYAVQFFPITRKTMGGIDVDLRCRVLDKTGQPIQGLYAVGEATGFGGINGKAALEGTFLGPSILMGRIAGRTAVEESPVSKQKRSVPASEPPATFANAACTSCHDLGRDTKIQRTGYWHFEQSHRKVLERQYRCASCHQHLYPFMAAHHKQDHLALYNVCSTCHAAR